MSEELESLRLRIHELEKTTRRLAVLLAALGAGIVIIFLVGAGTKKDEDNVTAKTISSDFISTKTLYVASWSGTQHIDISALPVVGLEIGFYDANKQFPPRLSLSLDTAGPNIPLLSPQPKSP